MIGTGKTNSPTHHVKKRSKTMKGRTLGPGEFRIVPSEPGKAIRIVQFHQYEKGDIQIDCFEEGSNISCPGNAHGRLCSHVFKAIALLLDGQKRK
jgi:hypothetical protein